MSDIKYMCDITVSLTPGNILGINTNLKINARDRYTFKIFSLTALKQVTRLWKQANSPDLQDDRTNTGNGTTHSNG